MHRIHAMVVAGLAVSLMGAVVQAADMHNAVVAVVNDEVITKQDLETVLFIEQPKQAHLMALSEAERVRVGLQQLIEERLILQAAQTAKIEASSKVLDARMASVRQEFATQTEFEISLADAGLTQSMLRRRYRDQLIMQRALDHSVRARIVVRPSEVQAYYDAHPEEMRASNRARAEHILVRVTEERTTKEALARATDIVQQLRDGGDFARLAAAMSDGPEASTGGALGWVSPGQLRSEVDAAIFRMPVGQTSAPIQSSLGYHIIRVLEQVEGGRWTLDEVELSIREKIFQQKFELQLAEWLRELRQQSYIVIKLPFANGETPNS
jgi:peptidyl-prolyl cis-trans isomerase SurA